MNSRFERFRSASDSQVPVRVGSTVVGSVRVTNEIDLDTLTASLRLDWRIAKRLFTFLDYRYRDQTSDDSVARSEFDVHRVMLGFRYSFPIDLK